MPQQLTMFSADRETQKRLGAYYTDELVADLLVAWAVRQPTDCVIDPGFGAGVFSSLRLCANCGSRRKSVRATMGPGN